MSNNRILYYTFANVCYIFIFQFKKLRIMKKLLFLVLGVFLLFSCEQAEVEKTMDQETNNDFEVIDNGSLLKFKDKIAFDATLTKLKSMNFEEQQKWTESIKFNSLYVAYVDALDKISNDQNISYYDIKQEYQGILYFPEYNDDYGIYLPVSKKEYSPLLSQDGNVMIGNEVLNFVDIKDYESLKKTGNALYSDESSILRANNIQIVYEGDYIGQQYVSSWNERPAGNTIKRLRIKLGRLACWPASDSWLPWCLHLEVDFRQQLAGGEWTTTSGRTNFDGKTFTSNYPSNFESYNSMTGMGPYPQNIYMYINADNRPGSYDVYNIERIAAELTTNLRVVCSTDVYNFSNIILPEQTYSIRR